MWGHPLIFVLDCFLAIVSQPVNYSLCSGPSCSIQTVHSGAPKGDACRGMCTNTSTFTGPPQSWLHQPIRCSARQHRKGWSHYFRKLPTRSAEWLSLYTAQEVLNTTIFTATNFTSPIKVLGRFHQQPYLLALWQNCWPACHHIEGGNQSTQCALYYPGLPAWPHLTLYLL